MTKTATPDAAPRPRRRFRRSEPRDELLAGRAATGDDAAFTVLYERYYGPLLGYTGSILLDGEDARDATQNALENALRALPGRDTSRPLRPWLYKIAHNEAITIIRRRRRHSELTEDCEPTVPGPEVDAEQRRRLAQLVDDLRTLPERQRGALVMRELNGLSYDEIGLALGLSNDAARRAVCDARSALHDAVDGRATACASVRRSISDGDRRSLRARAIRAHLRSCHACATFQRSIDARRADLQVLAPWICGAAVLSAAGGGVGVGGSALVAGGGVSAAAGGGGLTWGGLPPAVKGLAVVAAVAGTGAAAVEIERAATPDRTAPKSQTAHARSTPSRPATARDRAPRQDRRPRATTRATTRAARSSKRSTATVRARAGKPAPRAPRRSVPDRPTLRAPRPAVPDQPAAAAKPKPSPKPRSPAATPPASTSSVRAPEELAKAKLAILTDKVRQVIAQAQALAAGGTQNGFSLAASMLQRTLPPLLASIDQVLAPFGLTAATASATAGSPALADVLGPLRGMLDSVQLLLQRMLGAGGRAVAP